MRYVLVPILVLILAMPGVARTQQPDGQLWRSFVEKIEVGTTLKVRLKEGPRVKATLLQVSPDAIVLKPKTRVPVPAQSVPFEAIESLEIDRPGGIGVGKAVAIGVASGVGAFLGVLMILAATLD